jgi:hypothetical protein
MIVPFNNMTQKHDIMSYQKFMITLSNLFVNCTYNYF